MTKLRDFYAFAVCNITENKLALYPEKKYLEICVQKKVNETRVRPADKKADIYS